MDEDQARARLTAERAEVEQTLHEAAAEAATWQDDEVGAEINDAADSAQTLTAEDMADAVTTRFRDRIAAIDRALQRLDNGTYGYSVRSGVPIPAERLDADPAAELTIEEARTRGLTPRCGAQLAQLRLRARLPVPRLAAACPRATRAAVRFAGLAAAVGRPRPVAGRPGPVARRPRPPPLRAAAGRGRDQKQNRRDREGCSSVSFQHRLPL